MGAERRQVLGAFYLSSKRLWVGKAQRCGAYVSEKNDAIEKTASYLLLCLAVYTGEMVTNDI